MIDMSELTPVIEGTDLRNLISNKFQEMFKALSGIEGELVREKYQKNPLAFPKSVDTNWLSFFVNTVNVNQDSFQRINSQDDLTMVNDLSVSVDVSLYGPKSFEIALLIFDGLRLHFNRTILRSNGLYLNSIGNPTTFAEPRGGVNYKRCDFTLTFGVVVSNLTNFKTLTSFSAHILADASGTLIESTTEITEEQA